VVVELPSSPLADLLAAIRFIAPCSGYPAAVAGFRELDTVLEEF
jgi:hypothetical protein